MLKIMIMIFSFFITPAFANTPLGKAKNYYLDQGFNKLKIEELKKMFPNHSIDPYMGKAMYPYYVDENGKLYIKVKNKVRVTNWAFKDDNFCLESLRGGILCIEVFKKKDEFIGCATREVTCIYRFTNFRKGDDRKLKN